MVIPNPRRSHAREVAEIEKPEVRTGFFLVQRKSFPVPLLELFKLLVNSELFVGVQSRPLGLDVGQRNDGVVCPGSGRGCGGERTRELPVGDPDGADETSSVHLEEVREGCKVCELKNGTRRSGCLFLQKPLPPIGSSSDFLTHLHPELGSNVTSDNSLVVHETRGIHHAQDIVKGK